MRASSGSVPSRTSTPPRARRRRPRCNSTSANLRRTNREFVRRALIILALLVGFRLCAAEVIPPAPAKYFNDYAQVVSSDTAAQLNQTLESFEKESSDQIVVV